jgi:hypothetical protein
LSSHLLSKIVKIKIHTTIILPAVFWPLTLREEHRLEIFENRLLRRLFGNKRD